MKIHAIETGRVNIKENQRVGRGPGRLRVLNTLVGREWAGYLPINAWLIEHPDGAIMVDAGETARTSEPGYFPRWQVYYSLAVRLDVTPDDQAGALLNARGFDSTKIPRVVMTHMHTDHAGGLHDFPGAEVMIHRPELDAYSGKLAKLDGYLPHRAPSGFAPSSTTLDDGPYLGFEASKVLTSAGDVRIVATPGHTPGHVSVIVEEGDRLVMFAGDTSYSESTMLDLAVDGVAPSARDALRTLKKIRALARERELVYLPTHDPDSAERLAQRTAVPAA